MMQTVILCGGVGMRLREETEFRPKPMVEIGDKPILWHIMKIYSFYGHKSFICPLGYKGEYIKDYFLNFRTRNSDFRLQTRVGTIDTLHEPSKENDDFSIIFADTGFDTPHGERLLRVGQYITEQDFMVTYGDGVADVHIPSLIEFHRSKNLIGTITGVHPISRWGMVNASDDDRVLEFRQKPDLYDYVNGGFMIFKKEFFNYLKPGDMIEDAFERLIAEKQLALYRHDGFWYGMDTYRDMVYLNQLWRESKPWKVWN